MGAHGIHAWGMGRMGLMHGAWGAWVYAWDMGCMGNMENMHGHTWVHGTQGELCHDRGSYTWLHMLNCIHYQ